MLRELAKSESNQVKYTFSNKAEKNSLPHATK